MGGTVARGALGMMLLAGTAEGFHTTSSLPQSAAVRAAKCGASALSMAEEPKKGLKAKLAAAGAALSVFGAAPLPAAAAARAAPAAEKPALELKLTESQLKTAAVSAVAVGGAYAILGNKGGSKMLGPGESRSLGHKVLFKGVPPAPALSSGVSIEDKAGMEKVWKQTGAIKTGATYPLGVALAQVEGVDMLDPSKVNSISSAMSDRMTFEEFMTAVQLYTGKSASWAAAPPAKQATRVNL